MADEALIRRQRLRSLKLTPSQLAERLGKKQSYFSDLMNLDGTKSFGEKAARAIEQGLTLPPFWLDGPRAQADQDQGVRLSLADAPQDDANGLRAALAVLGSALDQNLTDDVREDVADTLAKMAMRRGSPRLQALIASLLQPVDGDIHQAALHLDTPQDNRPMPAHHPVSPQTLGGVTGGEGEWDVKRQKHNQPGGQSTATTHMNDGKPAPAKRREQT